MATPIPSNAACFTLDEIAEATGGRVVGDGGLAIEGVFTDSRSSRPEGLFVALRGERFDAHRFLADVDAAAALVSDESADGPKHRVVVEDTTEALGAIAQAHRLRWGQGGGRLVAITGSAGKTSTKAMTAAALRGAGLRVRATEGNLNNLVGVPMTLLTLTDDDQVAVVEMGTSAPGEIAALAAYALPDVALVTGVSEAHTAGLGGIEGVLEEKASLYAVLEEEDVAIVNVDDRRLSRVHVDARRVEFGTSEEAEVRLIEWSFEELRTLARIDVAGTVVEVRTALLGEAAARNATAALAIAYALDADVRMAAAALAELGPVAGRMSPQLRADGLLVLDDSYNANPASTRMALDTAAAIARSRGAHLWAVLGDMKELGGASDAAHRRLLEYAFPRARLVLVGAEMEAARADLDLDVMSVSLASDVRLEVGAGDVVLVKGSRSMALEQVVTSLAGVAA